MDLVFSSVFIIEAILKIISLGFLFNGKTSYLRDWWNVLDFLIVASSIAMIVIQAVSAAGAVSRTICKLTPHAHTHLSHVNK